MGQLKSVLLLCRWIKDQDDKLPEESDEDNIATLKEKEGKIAVSCRHLHCDVYVYLIGRSPLGLFRTNINKQ